MARLTVVCFNLLHVMNHLKIIIVIAESIFIGYPNQPTNLLKLWRSWNRDAKGVEQEGNNQIYIYVSLPLFDRLYNQLHSDFFKKRIKDWRVALVYLLNLFYVFNFCMTYTNSYMFYIVHSFNMYT